MDTIPKPPEGFNHQRMNLLRTERKDRIYMVLCDTGGVPISTHETRDLAGRAARDVARRYPGKRIHILQTWRIAIACDA